MRQPQDPRSAELLRDPALHLEVLLDHIEGHNRHCCKQVYTEHAERINTAPGSRRKHHAWRGGYRHHVEQSMNLFRALYHTVPQDHLPQDERFTESDGLVVMWLHDIEKPFLYRFDGHGAIVKDNVLPGKAVRADFRNNLIEHYGFDLSATQQNALRYVEGVRDHEYDPLVRTEQPLAALCHAADIISARTLYDRQAPL